MAIRKYVSNPTGRAIGYIQWDTDRPDNYTATFLDNGERSVNIKTQADAEREVRELERDACVIF